MSRQTSEFAQIIDDVDTMSEDQCRIIADGHEEESFTIAIDNYASADEFHRAVVQEIMKLLDLG